MTSRRRSAKRTFGEISKSPSGRFRARFTGPDLNRHSANTTFVARVDAEGWLVTQERAISRGEWSPPVCQVAETPQQRPPTLSQYAATVIGRRRLRPRLVLLLLAGWCRCCWPAGAACAPVRCGRCASVTSTWTPVWCGCAKVSSDTRPGRPAVPRRGRRLTVE